MNHLRLTLALIVITGPALAAERAPMPRVVTPPITVDEAVRKVDGHLTAFWAKNEIQPAPNADDAEFLRRVSLDLVGRIPTASEARSFIESKDRDKRSKKIDELIGRPGFLN